MVAVRMVSCEAEKHAKIPSLRERERNLVFVLLANLNANLSSLQMWKRTYFVLSIICIVENTFIFIVTNISSGFLWTTVQDVYPSGGIVSQCILLLYSN